jgi:PTH1 family peptidyl-tRNA hydrolase
MNETARPEIKAIIGLGNPGSKYQYNRHNIGFRVLDMLADRYSGNWSTKDEAQQAEIRIGENRIILIKPQTFMNSSGRVIPGLQKKGITAEHILVVHDELELPFGTVKLKQGGSAKGHNGLKSIIASCGPDFWRLRCGIARPADRDNVPDYVLTNFSEPATQVEGMMYLAVDAIDQLFTI